MKILKNISVNIKKIFSSYGVYICIIFTVILCFGTGIYIDGSNNNEYSAIKSLLVFNHDFMKTNTEFCSVNVALKVLNGWITMFIPIIGAFSYIPLVCDEFESKAVRITVFRSSKSSYYASKFLTACISGGLTVLMGYIITIIMIFAFFPNISEYSEELQNIFKESLFSDYSNVSSCNYINILLLKCSEVFVYGAFSAVPSIVLTAITRNKYLIICLPFFFKYAATQTCLKLSSKAYSDFENIDIHLGRIANIFSPDSMLRVFESYDKTFILIYNFGLVIIAYKLYMFINSRRFDCGE